MKNSLKTLALGILAVALFGATALSAQVETGQLAGTVTDPLGAVIAGATVTVKNIGTNAVRNETTSDTGAYKVTGLGPATYQISIQSANFQPFNAKVQITVGGHITLDATLSVSSSTTQVEVVGEGGSQVNTQSQELSQIVNEEQIARLPSLPAILMISLPSPATSRPATVLQAAIRAPTIRIRMDQARRGLWGSASTAREQRH